MLTKDAAELRGSSAPGCAATSDCDFGPGRGSGMDLKTVLLSAGETKREWLEERLNPRVGAASDAKGAAAAEAGKSRAPSSSAAAVALV